jgi:endonuclease-3
MSPKKRQVSGSTSSALVAPTESSVRFVMQTLLDRYGTFETELHYRNPFELLVAVILSAQTTDERVNQVTPALFAAYPTPERLAEAPLPELEAIVRPTGFFRQKAKRIRATARSLVDRFGGVVPSNIDDLVTLPGVGRKTASVVLNQAFDVPAIAVDTHVRRVALRLGWAKAYDPETIEQELMATVPRELWSAINGLLILHGRRLCSARKPLCPECPIREHCATGRGKLPLLASNPKPPAPRSLPTRKPYASATRTGRRA